MRSVWLTFLSLALTPACAAETPAASQSAASQSAASEDVPAEASSAQNHAPQSPLRAAASKDDASANPVSGTVKLAQPAPQSIPLGCTGIIAQGGLVTCQTLPHAKVKIGRSADDFYYESADENGRILVGFDRDETRTFIQALSPKKMGARQASDTLSFDFKKRAYDTSRIDGLPPSQVSTFSETQLKRIRSSSARKKKGFASRSGQLGFTDGFVLPVSEFTKTTNFGAQRILNGEPKKPHYGVDLAAPVGTPIYAPADGIVSLSDDDLYFEGAMVLLDHGQGLISMYLHVDEMMVEPGQMVKRGEQIATVGSKGRSTGPHLCWRLKWRNRNLDPELLTKWSERAETTR